MHGAAWCGACVGVRTGLGGSTGVADTAAEDAGGASALIGVLRENEVRRASQLAGEGGAMTPSPKEGSGAHKCGQARVRGRRMLG